MSTGRYRVRVLGGGRPGAGQGRVRGPAGLRRRHRGGRPGRGRRRELTDRELEVLRLLARGHSNRQIARDLVISDLTAKTHVSWILTKLDLASRVHAVVFAYETGLVTPGTEG